MHLQSIISTVATLILASGVLAGDRCTASLKYPICPIFANIVSLRTVSACNGKRNGEKCEWDDGRPGVGLHSGRK